MCTSTKNLYIFLLLLLMVLVSTPTLGAYNDYDIPYQDNDNSYVNVKRNKYKDLDLDSDFNIIEKVNIKELGIPSCSDVPLTFAQCLPSICFETTPFGKIYRKIKGENKDGSCEYIERSPGYGGMDCTFNKDEAVAASNIIGKYFAKIANPLKEVTKEDVTQVRTLIADKCIIVKDSAITNLITINTPLDKKAVDPELVISYEELAKMQGISSENAILPQLSTGKAPLTVGQTQVQQSGSPGDTSIKSSMFTKEELDKIDNVIRGFDTQREEALGIFTANGIGFYLNSIIYYGHNKWVIWLNGKKFTTPETGTELTINRVSKDSVEFTWTTKDLDKTVPNWRRRLVYVNDNLYTSVENNIKVETVGEDDNLVKFMLRPNQTMSISTMTISEGNKS